MKYRLLLLCIPILLLIGVYSLIIGETPIVIHIEGAESIQAGDVWMMKVKIDEVEAGEKVQVMLFNGLTRQDDTLILGTGGVAEWHPSTPLTQAGKSLVIVRYGSTEKRLTFHVTPSDSTDLDLFATANNLPSYGTGQALVMILPRDKWGNAPPDHTPFQASVRFPDATQKTLTFNYRSSLGWALMRSYGGPGRVRIDVNQDALKGSIELLQLPSTPYAVDLSITPSCVLSDGRDVVLLKAFVVDEQKAPVADGTLVIFTWEKGFGYGLTTEGQALLRLPAPTNAGTRLYTASSGQAASKTASLMIEEETCADEP